MHIYLIHTRYPHWCTHSGINQFLKYIDIINYKIKVKQIPDNDEDFPVQNRLIRKYLRNIIQKRGMKWYKLSDLTAEIKALAHCYFRKVDIIHYLDGEHSAQFLPGLLKRLRKIRPRVVATYHQPPEILDSLIIKDVIRKHDCITVVSPEQVSYFREFIDHDKIHLILHGIDTDYFKPRDIPKTKGKFQCITVGHYLRDFKAVRLVAEKLKDFHEIGFNVVSSQTGEVEGLKNITIYKNIDDAQLLKLYQQSDVLFLPLVQSTANNALLEGIACGLPVVSTSLPSVKAYLPGSEAILIKNNNPEQLSEALLHLFHNQDERVTMGQKARKRAEELAWHTIAPLYEAVYSKLAGNG
ncbi:MAG: glycosyltransferase family 4 protein [Candidatus Brocadia sinica]|nr:glycosyltransferase family 4 protein [Candidatus Brocadia sinica]NUO05451.1 glycosyltransferase family 4 protein [Candidatus Brocadia sinica]